MDGTRVNHRPYETRRNSISIHMETFHEPDNICKEWEENLLVFTGVVAKRNYNFFVNNSQQRLSIGVTGYNFSGSKYC